MNVYEKCQKALFECLTKTDFRDRWYYFLVIEGEPFNSKCLYKVELEPSRENDYTDLNLIFDMDYDEGQDIDIKYVCSEDYLKHILFKLYYWGFLNEQ